MDHLPSSRETHMAHVQCAFMIQPSDLFQCIQQVANDNLLSHSLLTPYLTSMPSQLSGNMLVEDGGPTVDEVALRQGLTLSRSGRVRAKKQHQRMATYLQCHRDMANGKKSGIVLFVSIKPKRQRVNMLDGVSNMQRSKSLRTGNWTNRTREYERRYQLTLWIYVGMMAIQNGQIPS